MKVVVGSNAPVELGVTETTPTVSIDDFSRRETDAFGVTTVVERGFSRKLSMRMLLSFDDADRVQRVLAGLRATTARWVADDRFAWLQPVGFFKDFEVDLSTPSINFCTLTIEGFAETEAGALGTVDPAPPGLASTLQMLLPVAVTDGTLASSVPETDAPAWSNGATYPVGTHVVSAHRIFESLVASNTANDPATSPVQWLDVGPTNRWAMFDEALGTATMATSGSITVTLTPGVVGALALLDVQGASVRLKLTVLGQTQPRYDRTIANIGAAITFLDLPAVSGTLQVTITGSGTVSVGTLLIGNLYALGVTEESPTASITDYSLKDVDDFGGVTIVERAWGKKMSANALIATDQLDVTANRIAAVRARPVLWLAQAGIDSLTVYGFFRDFSIVVGESTSKLSLTIEGLSKATEIQPLFALLRVQWSYDGLVDWHDDYQDGDRYFRQSVDGGATWGPAVRAVGEPGPAGGGGPQGPPGVNGQTLYTWIAYANSADGSVDFTTGSGVGRSYIGIANNKTSAIEGTTPSDYTWSLIKGTDGVPGTPGPNGQTTYTWIAYASSADGSQNFTTGAPTSVQSYLGLAANKLTATESTDYHDYYWSKIRGDDGLQGAQGLPGTDGAPGTPGPNGANGISVHIAYADSIDGSVNFTTGDAGTRAYVGVYTDTSAGPDSSNPSAYAWSRWRGQDGGNGIPGPPGANGQTTYVHIAYASSADGSVNFDTSVPTGRTYIGVRTDYVLADSTNYADYAWSLIKGADGAPGSPGTPGSPGSPGAPGVTPYTFDVSTNSVDIACTTAGVIKSGQLPRYITPMVKQGTVDVLGSASLGFSPSASGLAADYTSTPYIEITQADAQGFIDVTCSIAGTPVGTKRVSVNRVPDLPPPAGSTTQNNNDVLVLQRTDTSYGVRATTVLSLRANSAGNITYSFAATFDCEGTQQNPDKTFRVAGKAQYRATGGSSYSDWGSEVACSTDAVLPGRVSGSDAVVGELNVGGTITGLTAGVLYDVIMAIRCSGGAGTGTTSVVQTINSISQ